MSLPDKLTENWQESPSDLFTDLNPKSFNNTLEDGTIIQLKLQIHDQLENEIFFPTVKLAKDNQPDATIEQLTIFRENLSIPENYSLVDNDDFSTATERKIYVGCREESGDHNDDKKKEIFKIKLYSKEMNLRVLQLYDVVGVFYKPDIIHVISCSENINVPITSNELESIEELRTVCRQAMLGDDLAGQILLATMASEIYLRRDVLCLGNMSVNFNIKNCEPGSSTRIIDAISRLYPKTRILPMSLKTLNSKPFIPIKNYEKEKLEHSELSIPDGFILILDETQLSAGKLTEIGTANLGNINRLIQHQKLSFDYQFYQKDFDVKINTIIISEGKTVLPAVYKVVINPDKQSDQVMNSQNANLLMNQIKEIGTKYAVKDNEMAESFIMQTRKDDSSIGVEELHQIMVLARGLSISNLEQEASKNRLEEARQIMAKLKTQA